MAALGLGLSSSIDGIEDIFNRNIVNAAFVDFTDFGNLGETIENLMATATTMPMSGASGFSGGDWKWLDDFESVNQWQNLRNASLVALTPLYAELMKRINGGPPS